MPRIITGWIATLLAMGVAPAWTAAHPADARLMLGSAVVGQATSDDSPETVRQKTVDLCKRARQAMDEGRYETADSLLGRAEAMNANFGMMYFGDTPKKVRRDLERMHRSKADTKRPSAKFAPSTVSEADRPNEVPNAAAAAAAAAAAGSSMTPPANSPGLSLTDPKGHAKSFLAKARQELAQGNVSAATYYYRKAMQAGAQFGPGEDSPAALLADLQRAGAKLTQAHRQPAAWTSTICRRPRDRWPPRRPSRRNRRSANRPKMHRRPAPNQDRFSPKKRRRPDLIRRLRPCWPRLQPGRPSARPRRRCRHRRKQRRRPAADSGRLPRSNRRGRPPGAKRQAAVGRSPHAGHG